MIFSFILAFLFFGLIVMILPADRKSDWLYVILLCVLFLSFGMQVSFHDFSLSIPEFSLEEQSLSAEKQALSFAVSREVYTLIGEYPKTVECDITAEEGEYSLNKIHVTMSRGNPKEVEYALQEAFSFAGFTVSGAMVQESGNHRLVSP